jgi:hypothetical protein
VAAGRTSRVGSIRTKLKILFEEMFLAKDRVLLEEHRHFLGKGRILLAKRR